MKTTILSLFFLISTLFCWSQKIEVKTNNVTQVIFPHDIDYHKGGFRPTDLLVENVKNVLFITPIHDGIAPTNLCVVTSAGMYFNVVITYNETPTRQGYVFTAQEAFYQNSSILDSLVNISKPKESPLDTLDLLANKILDIPGFINTGNTVKYKNFFFHLKGVYVNDKTIFIRLNAVNRSNIRFDFDYIAFYINIEKKKKNTTSEQLQLFPIRDFNYKNILEADQDIDFIFAFSKFTIGAEKVLNIDLLEKNGERNLKLQIDDRILLNAKPINL